MFSAEIVDGEQIQLQLRFVRRSQTIPVDLNVDPISDFNQYSFEISVAVADDMADVAVEWKRHRLRLDNIDEEKSFTVTSKAHYQENCPVEEDISLIFVITD